MLYPKWSQGGKILISDDSKKVTIDDKDYDWNDLSSNAKAQLENIKFVDEMLQQLQNEWAVADTARIGYTNALKNDAQTAD